MTTRKRSTTPEAEDLADVPFIDDAERDEAMWLSTRERDPSAPAPSSKIASDYVEIEELLGNLPPGTSDQRWHEEVLRAASSAAPPSRPWWRGTGFRWATAGAFVAVSAAAVLVLIPRAPDDRTATSELEVEIRPPDPARSVSREAVGGEQRGVTKAALRDQLVVTARPRGAGDLRVFRSSGTLVAKCPDGPACRPSTHGEYTIDLTLDAPVPYQVILVVGLSNALPNGTMNAHLKAAQNAGARIVTHEIDVQ